MRVVAGVARGRPLRAPAGRSTRPTSDRVREAVFSMLDSLDVVAGATVLDLFAGSGALGIEAISRGAASATFVDDDQAAVATIRANLASLDLRSFDVGAVGVGAVDVGAVDMEAVIVGTGRVRVVRADATDFARRAPATDVVLVDPPYAYEGWESLSEALASVAGLLVAESGTELDLGPAWDSFKVKRYGGTVVTLARPTRRSERFSH